MIDKLSIRRYHPTLDSHQHDYHQLVLPLHGIIEMTVGSERYAVGIGHCAIIQAGVTHSFQALEQARFLVADLSELPANLIKINTPFVATSNALQHFCKFAEAQLEHHLNVALEDSMMTLFTQLLETEDFLPRLDPRIARVLERLTADLANTPSLDDLARHANLSVSQLKMLFKKQTGKTCGQFLLMRRMEKARALLANTDFPAHLIAEKVGYQDQSAFSRRFNAYFGQTPRSLMTR